MPTPLETAFRAVLGEGRNRRIVPSETKGVPGTRIFGGYIIENERDSKLTDRERYRTFSNIIANCSVASAGLRYFINLLAKASWSFVPNEDHPDGVRLAEMAEQMLMEDPQTPWHRVVRRAGMYRFYGFSFQEWTARRNEEQLWTYDDIAPRPQITIERWDMNVDGTMNGVVQRAPQNQQEIYLPRGKLMYLVDDTLNDSPQGLGLLRHIVEPAQRLARYEQLEGFGFETDLRGMPVGYAPYAELREQLRSNQITAQQAKNATEAIEQAVEKQIKTPARGLLLDSDVYVTTDGSQRPSNQQKYRLELLQGSPTSLPDMANAIERINREIARILGVESIILGDGDSGSHALARDKTNQLSLIVNGTLREISEAVRDDLLTTLWNLNGWDPQAMPKIKVEDVQYRDIEQITGALREMANAGAILEPDDPAINEVRALLGLSETDDMGRDEDAALRGEREDPVEENGVIDNDDT